MNRFHSGRNLNRSLIVNKDQLSRFSRIETPKLSIRRPILSFITLKFFLILTEKKENKLVTFAFIAILYLVFLVLFLDHHL